MRTDETAPTGDQDLHGLQRTKHPARPGPKLGQLSIYRTFVGLDVRLSGLDIRSRLCSGLSWTRFAASDSAGGCAHSGNPPCRETIPAILLAACLLAALFGALARCLHGGGPKKAAEEEGEGHPLRPRRRRDPQRPRPQRRRRPQAQRRGPGCRRRRTPERLRPRHRRATASRTRSTRTATPPATSSERAPRRPRRLRASSGSSRMTRSGAPTPTRAARARWPRSPAPGRACCASRSTGR